MAVLLPSDFQFHQGNLQDYAICPRRFHWRHVRRLAWPAVESEPYLEWERHLRLGEAFHRLVCQHLLGMDGARLQAAAEAAGVSHWWRNYLEHPPTELPATRYPEATLSALVGGYRLVGKYDLIALGEDGRAAIVDWKTSRRRPQQDYLVGSMQTRAYRYLLVQAGSHLNGGQALRPEQVEMIYWFADHPERPVRLPYDAARFQADGAFLEGLIEEIASREDGFPPSPDGRHCPFCVYRSLCEQGVQAGDLQDFEDALVEEVVLGLELEQVGEVEF